MYAALVLTLSLMALATFAGIVEASRRHVVCVRFEHHLRRDNEGSGIEDA